MSRGKILFLLACTVVVVALVGIGIALQKHIDTAAEGDIKSALERQRETATAPATTDETTDYYVGGRVRHPGVFSLPARPVPTLSVALAAAGGANTDATTATTVQLIRKAGDTTQTTAVPLTELLAGHKDEPLQPGDVINVVKQIDATTLPANERQLPVLPAK